MRRLGVFVASCGYIGYIPFAPGTFGSAAGLVVFFLVRRTGSIAVEVAAIAILFAIGIWSGSEAERHFGKVDPGPVVLDEVVGMLITLYLLPASWLYLTLGFFMFRLFDIVKPFPARRIDQGLGGGLGVMLDDVVAGIYANICLQVLRAVLK